MSDLSLGGGGELTWSYPSPVYISGEYRLGGMVWMGKQEATVEDIEAMRNYYGPDAEVDKTSLCGLWCWRWSSLFTRHSTGQPAGGIGSQTYELQHVGDGAGALFAKDDIWYTTCLGEFVKGVPPEAGCYHLKYVGDGYHDAYEGPEVGSPADLIRGNGEFYWDDERKLYDVK